MSIQDQKPEIDNPASQSTARDLVPYAAPASKSLPGGAESLLGSLWFRGGCLAVAVSAGVAAGYVAMDRGQSKIASAQTQEMRELTDQIAALRQTVGDQGAGDRQTLASLRASIEQMQRAAADSLQRSTSELKRIEAARAATEARFAERFDRLEKQTSSATPTATIPSAAGPKASAAQLPPAAAGKDTSVVPMSASASPPPRPEIPVRGYVLRGVDGKVALVETRSGMREVVTGQILPGAGRVQSIEKRGRKWVLVTSEGIIDGDAYR